MSSFNILSTFESTFPGLYKRKEADAEPEEPAAAPAPPPVQAEPSGEADPYNTRIAGITSRVNALHVLQR